MLDWLLEKAEPFIKWQGSLHMPWTHKKITGVHYYKYRKQIQPGTVLLATTYGEISNLFNPAKIKHAAIYMGVCPEGIEWAFESTGKGTIKKDLVTFATTKDVIIALEPTFLTQLERKLVYHTCKELLGLPYDYRFNSDDEALYCFEAVIAVLDRLRPGLSFKESKILGKKKIYDHNTFLKDANKFTILFDSRGQDE